MAPTIGRLALHNRSYGSILGDWVAPPPQNIHMYYNRGIDKLLAFGKVLKIIEDFSTEMNV